MTDLEIIKYIAAPSSAALVVVMGWAVAHYLAQRRDRKTKARELSTEYLISAYRSLFRVGVERFIAKNAVECENAIADIQLFGSLKQIELAEKYTKEISNEGSADLTEIIKELRQSLRSELKLSKANDEIHFLKIDVVDKQA
tara:strand:- start:261 stop:686 length:426 start_codon:yes stop_codon:yes gene_type:complete